MIELGVEMGWIDVDIEDRERFSIGEICIYPSPGHSGAGRTGNHLAITIISWRSRVEIIASWRE